MDPITFGFDEWGLSTAGKGDQLINDTGQLNYLFPYFWKLGRSKFA
jgi:hypothetical protein